MTLADFRWWLFLAPTFLLISVFHLAPAAAMSTMSCQDLSSSIVVRGAGETSVNGVYAPRDPTRVPAGFARTCDEMGWHPRDTWRRLSNGDRPWFESSNESYIYWNCGDRRWWIDAPSGAGVYIVPSEKSLPPKSGWVALPGAKSPVPEVDTVQDDRKLEK
eukprot:CAMPEP_0183293266 /NCGR_PEP_ID=MMETSP0160_2-20130417/2016_1 /TAXON_ID=2839 ORGANISM="Odontella Sinensis, Strain Grunow 1884" /NCGR_SAMPLE_ID=MMETSP0160_2 /ASSEMBLY_ACC=CAM_ASM_000250 /LENGTH=160 /DNA_ID=CAMNT_0025454353 /DNA_START=13 /DNA_END=495 /DNA_ORIENTATION=+